MIEPAQVVELVVGEAGEIEAVMLPRRGGGIRWGHWRAAWRMLPLHETDGAACRLAEAWQCGVICTPDFAARHEAAGTTRKPAPQHRLFFAHG